MQQHDADRLMDSSALTSAAMDRTTLRQHARREAFKRIRQGFKSNVALAEALGDGFSPSYVSQLLNGHRGIGDDVATKIEDRLGIAPNMLDAIERFDVLTATGTVSSPGSEFTAVQRVLLKVSAGVTGYRVEHLEGNGPPIFFRTDWLVSRGFKADKLYALKVSGESMEPGLWDGDLIVMNSADTNLVDGEVFVANYEGEVVIKRLERNAGEWWLTSDNGHRFKPKKCDEHAEILGRVIYKQSERI